MVPVAKLVRVLVEVARAVVVAATLSAPALALSLASVPVRRPLSVDHPSTRVIASSR